MIGTIRKHSKWLWAIVITVTIVSFVVFFSPNSKMSGGGNNVGNYGSVNGHRVTRDDYAEAQREVFLRYYFSTGNWLQRESDEEMMRETYIRLLLIKKQEELGIHVGSDAIAKAATGLLASFNRGNPVPLDAFVGQVLRPHGFVATDLARFIQHDLGIQQLAATAGLGGKLVTPQEVRALYERENQEVSAQAVFFSASNHLDEVTVTPEELMRFYTNHMADYRLPERVQVAYVEFPATNFLAEAEQELTQAGNLTERIEATYEKIGGTNYFRDAKSPEEAKQMIRNQMVKETALLRVRKDAYDFANELHAIEPLNAENLGALASKKGLSARLSETFDRQYPPPDLKVRADFNKQAFSLTADEPFAGPIVGEDAVFVIALKKKLPSETPSFEEVRKQVTEDYKIDRAVVLAQKAGSSFAAMLAAGIPNGKSFSSICVEAKVHPVLLPPFSLSTRSLPQAEQHTSLDKLKQAAFSVAPGKPGEFVPTSEGGLVVFVQSRLPLDTAKMNAELPQFTSHVRRSRENEAFNDWFRREAERGLRDTPLARRQAASRGVPPQ